MQLSLVGKGNAVAMTLRQRLGSNLRTARRAKDLTQEALADAAEMSKDMVSRIERGTAGASFETIEQLADAIGMSVEELIIGSVPASVGPRGQALQQIYARLSRFSDDQVLLAHDLVEAVANHKA